MYHACVHVCMSVPVHTFHMYIRMCMFPTLYVLTAPVVQDCAYRYIVSMCTYASSTYLPPLYGVFISESVHTEVGVDLDDHGAVVPPHLAKGLEAE